VWQLLRYWCSRARGSRLESVAAEEMTERYSFIRFCSISAFLPPLPLSVDRKPPPPNAAWAGRNDDSFFSLKLKAITAN